MPRPAFLPIPFRLPLSLVAALANAMARADGLRHGPGSRPTRLAMALRLQLRASATTVWSEPLPEKSPS